MTINRQTLNYLETFEGWLLIVFSYGNGYYYFEAFDPAGEKAGDRGIFSSIAAAVQAGRKFITGAKL